MKKTILFAVMMMATINTKAQISVDSIGRVKIGELSASYNTLTIHGHQGKSIYCYSNQTDNLQYGIYNSTSSNLNNNLFGIISQTTGYNTPNSNKIVAIRGNARLGAGTTGAAIGVWGAAERISTVPNRGVGVLGGTSMTFSNTLIDTLYAGYFNGLTKVRGDFIVTGHISGTLLGAPAAFTGVSQSQLSESNSSQRISNALKGLSANTYYHELTDETLRAMNAGNIPSRSQPFDEDNLTDEELIAMEEAMINSNAEDALPEFSTIEKQVLTKQHYGLDADQLEEVFPDLVYENEDGTKSINYVEMVPILVQAINELSAKVEVLEGKNAANKVATRSTTNVDEKGENIVVLSLSQNKPNPFGTTTSIEVSIPDEVQKAFIYVYDLQGKKVDQLDITARGKQTIQLNAANLSDGMYLYSFIADGKVIETRRMIVEK